MRWTGSFEYAVETRQRTSDSKEEDLLMVTTLQFSFSGCYMLMKTWFHFCQWGPLNATKWSFMGNFHKCVLLVWNMRSMLILRKSLFWAFLQYYLHGFKMCREGCSQVTFVMWPLLFWSHDPQLIKNLQDLSAWHLPYNPKLICVGQISCIWIWFLVFMSHS